MTQVCQYDIIVEWNWAGLVLARRGVRGGEGGGEARSRAQGSNEVFASARNRERLSQRVETYGVPSGSTFPAPVVRGESALSD